MLGLEVGMSVWLWAVVAFVVGGLVGVGGTVLFRRGSDIEARMRRLRREHEQYQAEVARHFSQTGELLSRLRTTFDQLYGEVQERATSLVGEEALQRRLGYLDNGSRNRLDHADETQGRNAGTVGDDRAGSPGFGGAGSGAAERGGESGAPTEPERASETQHAPGSQGAPDDPLDGRERH